MPPCIERMLAPGGVPIALRAGAVVICLGVRPTELTAAEKIMASGNAVSLIGAPRPLVGRRLARREKTGRAWRAS